jgi:hypothetical protein
MSLGSSDVDFGSYPDSFQNRPCVLEKWPLKKPSDIDSVYLPLHHPQPVQRTHAVIYIMADTSGTNTTAILLVMDESTPSNTAGDNIEKPSILTLPTEHHDIRNHSSPSHLHVIPGFLGDCSDVEE